MQAKSAGRAPLDAKGFLDAVAGPFIEFFQTHGLFALVMLLTITLYHLSDYLRGPIVNPFYHDGGFSQADQIGTWCSGTFGFCGRFPSVVAPLAGLQLATVGLLPHPDHRGGAPADRHRRLLPS